MILRTLVTVSAVLAGAAAIAASPPNIVLIVADDLGWKDLACYGSDSYETPHIDQLASSGVRYSDAYATCPVCSPSRASLMTGKNPARLGLTAHIGDPQPENWKRDTPLKPAPYIGNLPLEEITLAERLHDAGYATLHAGKWHLGGERHWPEYQGFDVNIGGWSQGGPFGGKQYYSPYANPRLSDGPEGEYLTDRLASEAAQFIHARRFKPFFVYLPFYSVHVPLVARKDLLEKYEQKFSRSDAIEMVQTLDGTERARQDHAVYAAMVEAMDQAVGVVLNAIQEAGVADNTIVVFTSDNGGLATGDIGISAEQGWPTTNKPLRAGKGWLYEGGIRVPLIVRPPGESVSGAVSSRVVTGCDLYRSLLTLAELDVPESEGLDSVSFAGSLAAEESQRPPAYWHYPHYGNQGGRPGGAMRMGDWKLIEWFGENENDSDVELYNLRDDIGEANNLADECPDRLQSMHTALREWRKELGARMPSPNNVSVSPTQVSLPDEKSNSARR
ncbi:Arylsulfatase [Posidoniimonas corsicana]|uniref:Arylsulfatase n=1 Tax=Posidoniimonas corsicana TaxID=1938618 RepID=A0A5C5VHJ5_9BACT|nr:sulfatase [Posidoniimonas corsicana]TWT37152.1 Arylsulfatase [Posidoniimonas corsicana]